MDKLFRVVLVGAGLYYLCTAAWWLISGRNVVISWLYIGAVVILVAGTWLTRRYQKKMVKQFGEFRELSEQQRDTIRELKADGRVVEAVRKTRVWYPSLGLVEAKKLIDEL
ncbi:hypothetical protein [Corynebacterium diphtheriae]|uniref:hypothetical protein n=1 Tax=Corynebacterium diphtheriae TaxID=1717 RepID=UPI000B4A801D|nr:hypothetical protein [Corynebacterium diphtheriae]OWM44658.1 hypothetical protein BU164_03690 [Corynebacterium diphtheriae]OWM51451.1 hypothetical protein BU163_01600 [Corynebacterium diphtheriae]OWN45281.1 hypothetical protein AY507_02400 [Corynebacterium diphtheriae bv. mitis]OWN61806.1 hypothetical protein AY521_06155 [Corynebacterium diphtheriae bv. mitis]OWN77756.1 hypothetical protein AY509_06895 [Corynebacterium diphtheriae bv. mitis]